LRRCSTGLVSLCAGLEDFKLGKVKSCCRQLNKIHYMSYQRHEQAKARLGCMLVMHESLQRMFSVPALDAVQDWMPSCR
jgi:hypothetical protein